MTANNYIQKIFPPDEVICDKELIQYTDLLLSKDQIVKSAAKKLDKSGKYADDLSKISAVINKLFPALSSSTISIALDDKYKRDYPKSEKSNNENDTPVTPFEEYLFILQDNLLSFNKAIKSILQTGRNDVNTQKVLDDIFTKSVKLFSKNHDDFIHEFTLNIKDIKNLGHLIDYTKKIGTEINVLEKNTDLKELFDSTIKTSLKLQLTSHNFKGIGKMSDNSSKYLKQLNSNPNFAAFLEDIKDCPKCGFDYSNYVKRAKIADSKGITIKKPTKKKRAKKRN